MTRVTCCIEKGFHVAFMLHEFLRDRQTAWLSHLFLRYIHHMQHEKDKQKAHNHGGYGLFYIAGEAGFEPALLSLTHQQISTFQKFMLHFMLHFLRVEITV